MSNIEQYKNTIYTIRKLSVGTASIAIASIIFLGGNALANEDNNTTRDNSVTVAPANNSPQADNILSATPNDEKSASDVHANTDLKNNTNEQTTNAVTNNNELTTLKEKSENTRTNIDNTTSASNSEQPIDSSNTDKPRRKRDISSQPENNNETKTLHNISEKTNKNPIQGKEFNGEYGFYLTANDKDGKKYSSTYGGYSFLSLDNLDPESIRGHFVLKNGDKDINSNIILTLPNYSKNGTANLVFDKENIDSKDGIAVKSKLGEDYSGQMRYGNANGEYRPLADYLQTYGNAAFGEQLRAIRLEGGSIKANDEVTFDFKLKLLKPSTEINRDLNTFSIYNFINGHNGYVTDNLNLAMIHHSDINTGERIGKYVYPVYRKEVDVDGGSNWVYVPELQELIPTSNEIFRFGRKDNNTRPESSIQAEEDAKGFYVVKSQDPDLVPYPNLSPYYFLLLDKAQKNISKHGYSVNPDRIDANFYIYGGRNGIKIENNGSVDSDREALAKEGAKFLHFQVVPSILLKEKQIFTASPDGGSWNPKTLVTQFTDPRTVKWLVSEDDSRQLDKNKLNLKITNVTPGVPETTVSEVSLAKPGKYKIEYSYNFGTTDKPLSISNTGYVDVVSDYQQVNIRVLDDTTNTTLSDGKVYSGKSNEVLNETTKENMKTSLDNIKKTYLDKGYKLVSEPLLPSKLDDTENFSANTDNNIQYVDVHLVHDTRVETEYKESKQIIHYSGAGDKTPVDKVTTDDKTFSREVTYDKVTNKVIGFPTAWSGTKTYSAVTTPVIKGYSPDNAEAGFGQVTPDNPTIEVTVSYSRIPDTVSKDSKTVSRIINVTYPDGKMETITQTVTFTRGKTVNSETDKVTFGAWSEDGKHTFEAFYPKAIKGFSPSRTVDAVVVSPESEDSTANVSYSRIPDTVSKDSKTVSRIINVTYPDGKMETITQTVTFTRGKTVNSETDKVTFGAWSEDGKHTFEAFYPKAIKGFSPSRTVDAVVVSPESEDIFINITYHKTPDVINPDNNNNNNDNNNNNKKPGNLNKVIDSKSQTTPKVKILAKTGINYSNTKLLITLLFELLILMVILFPRKIK